MKPPVVAVDRAKVLAVASALASAIVASVWGPSASVACDLHAVSDFSLNLTGATGHSPSTAINNTVSTIAADVTWLRYDSSNTYVRTNGVPSHDVGPFVGNPNTPASQNFLFRVPRSPAVNSGTKTTTALGPIGFMVNGVAFFNASDGHSYNNQGIWNQNANVVEAPSFDAAMGHPQQSGVYHYHQQPLGLRQQLGDDGSHHSPLLGFAFDGFPVYGPHGYANTDGAGGVKRIESSYQLRNITTRTTRADGSALTTAQYGPAVSASFPLGYYLEDYGYAGGSGDLDAYNGRFAVTPEYPQGTYAYYTTLDATGKAAYPYIVGPQYNGVLQNDNRTQTVSVAAGAGTYTAALSTSWSSATDGTWCVGSNWSAGNAPAGASTTATFGDVAGAPAGGIVVTLDTPQRVGTINFNTSNTRTIGGTRLLTLLSSTGAAVNVTSGTHTISAPSVLASATTFNVSASARLVVSNLQGTAAPLTKASGGTVETGILTAATLTISAGTLAVIPAAGGGPSSLGLLNLSSSATLDLNDNDLRTTTPKSTVEASVKRARNGGAWNDTGITSTNARANTSTGLGVLSGQEYLNLDNTTFGGLSVQASDTLVKYTWNGDTNYSGDVNFDDYVRVDLGFNTGLAGWSNGDFDYSGAVDFDDYVLIDIAFNTQGGTLGRAISFLDGTDRSESVRTPIGVQEVIEHYEQFGQSYAQAFLAAVPEPGMVALLLPVVTMTRRARIRRAWR